MKHKILWMGLSFLLVAALVLASCGEVAPGEQEEEEEEEEEPVGEQEEEEEEEPAVGEPQYGGTLSYLVMMSGDSPNFDIFYSPTWWVTSQYLNPIYEQMMVGDIEKFGPRGTDEYGFRIGEYIPEQYLVGQLVESWEVTAAPLGLTLHLRQGIMWTGNDNIGMEPREFVADDVIFHLNRYKALPGRDQEIIYVDSFTATDSHTVRIEFNTYSALWTMRLGYNSVDGGSMVQPPEVVEAGAEDWRNQTSNGAFILKEVVGGSYHVYEKNPGYWGKTTINGKEYQMPFIDELILPIILDEATSIASLRTGKLDWYAYVPLMYADSLARTCPEMIQYNYLKNSVPSLWINTIASGSKWTDVNLRRAMMIATDLEAIRDSVYISGDIHACPVGRGGAEYTPLEELPASTRMLFDYNPTEAKRLIADAGYPDGFKCEIWLGGAGQVGGTALDIVSMLVAMWDEVGVEVELVVMETTAHSAAGYAVSYPDFFYSGDWGAVPNNILPIGLSTFPRSFIKDPLYDEMYHDAWGTMDAAERTAKLKAVSLYFLDNVFMLPFTNPEILNCYWPWIRNYYNEIEVGYCNQMPMINRLWIDQDMKEAMGFK